MGYPMGLIMIEGEITTEGKLRDSESSDVEKMASGFPRVYSTVDCAYCTLASEEKVEMRG